MLLFDIEVLKQKLYNAIEHEDNSEILNISEELDTLIVEFYLGR
jgi:hypothetical protein